MKRLSNNKKGMTLIEVVISLAVLGIVASPLLMVFTNAQIMIRNTENRLEINAVMRIIKENVTRAVKDGGLGSGSNISSYDGEEYDLPNDTADMYTGINLEVKSHDNKINSKYKFDAVQTKTFGDTELGDAKNTCEYEITLKKMDGQIVQKLTLLVNKPQ